MKSDGLTGSDCFCTIYLDPANIGRTKIIRNTQDPVWNYESILSIFRTNIQIHINVKGRDPQTASVRFFKFFLVRVHRPLRSAFSLRYATGSLGSRGPTFRSVDSWFKMQMTLKILLKNKLAKKLTSTGYHLEITCPRDSNLLVVLGDLADLLLVFWTNLKKTSLL